MRRVFFLGGPSGPTIQVAEVTGASAPEVVVNPEAPRKSGTKDPNAAG